MVKVLIRVVPKAKEVMHRIVEVTADTGTTDTRSFRFQIEHLTDDASLPKETMIESWAVPSQGPHISDHPNTKAPITGNVLKKRTPAERFAAHPF